MFNLVKEAQSHPLDVSAQQFGLLEVKLEGGNFFFLLDWIQNQFSVRLPHQFNPQFFTASNPSIEKAAPKVVPKPDDWCWKGTEQPDVLVSPPTIGGLTRIASDPMRFVNDAVEGSTNLVGAVLKFAANLIAPEEDDGTKATHTHISLLTSAGSSQYLIYFSQLFHLSFCPQEICTQWEKKVRIGSNSDFLSCRSHHSAADKETKRKSCSLPSLSCSCWTVLLWFPQIDFMSRELLKMPPSALNVPL